MFCLKLYQSWLVSINDTSSYHPIRYQYTYQKITFDNWKSVPGQIFTIQADPTDPIENANIKTDPPKQKQYQNSRRFTYGSLQDIRHIEDWTDIRIVVPYYA